MDGRGDEVMTAGGDGEFEGAKMKMGMGCCRLWWRRWATTSTTTQLPTSQLMPLRQEGVEDKILTSKN